MSLSADTFGRLSLCGARASTSSSSSSQSSSSQPRWSSSQRLRGGTAWPYRDCAGGVTLKCRSRVYCQVAGGGGVVAGGGGGGGNLTVEDWTRKLPAKRKALYSHSLPCIEAWLHSLGFVQNKEDRAVWTIERPDWHAQLSLDVTDLYIRYLKKGPGNLDRDIERKFSYALSREDLENAILGGP